MSAGWMVGVDVGGTFTDVVLADGEGGIRVGKVLTTPHDPRVGVVDAVTSVLEQVGIDAQAVTRFVHGTTLATNVILQRTGGPVALIATDGFADLLRLGREARVEEDRYDLFFTPATPPVDPRLTFEVRERVTVSGEVLVELTGEAVDEVVARVIDAAPVAVAICFLHAYARPEHEHVVAAALRAARPDLFVVCSSDVWPEMREYERAMTTTVSALVGPVMATYLEGLEARLRGIGIGCAIEVMDSAGDVMSAARAASHPVATVESGGAAGVIAAGIVGRTVGAEEVISFDMGGTTAKAGIVRGGRPAVAHDFQVGGKGSFGGTRAGTGVPLKIPVVDLAEVGAGGGSIAAVDAGGALGVGPRSAGAAPGPACYGRGGEEPTVTDANLVLGYLDPAGLAGGVSLSVPLARAAIDRAVAGPLGVETVDAARAIHEIVNANMAAAIRVVTVQRGIDPRAFALVGFGGAGPMHITRVADEFGITSVVVPWGAGVASAVGLVSADLGTEHVQSFPADLDDLDSSELDAVLAELETRARVESGHEIDGEFIVSRFAGMRVRGQAHQLDVPLPDGPIDGAVSVMSARFRERYRTEYGVDTSGALQVVSVRVRVVRVVDKHAPTPGAAVAGSTRPAPAGERPAHFPERNGFVTTPVFDWPRLEPGATITGPAIIEGPDSTIVVLPDRTASVDRWRNVVLAR